MSLTMMWLLRCDMCGRSRSGHDGHKYIDAQGHFEFDRLYDEANFVERADGLLQCENHPRSVTA